MNGYSAASLTIGTIGVSKDNRGIQGLQLHLSAYQVRDNVASYGLHGVISRPLPGAQAAALSVGGDPSKSVILGTNDPRYYVAGLEDGAIGFAHHLGAKYLMVADGVSLDVNDKTLTITNSKSASIQADTQVLLDAPDVFTSGNLHVGTGASGTFTSLTGQIVTVRDGIIVNIF